MTIAMTSARTTTTVSMPALAPATRSDKGNDREARMGHRSESHHRKPRELSHSLDSSTSSDDSYERFLRERKAQQQANNSNNNNNNNNNGNANRNPKNQNLVGNAARTGLPPPPQLYPAGRYAGGVGTEEDGAKKRRKGSVERESEPSAPARASPPLFHLHRKGKPVQSESTDSGSPGRYLLPTRRSGGALRGNESAGGLETASSTPGPTTNHSMATTTTTTRSVGINTNTSAHAAPAKRDFSTKTFTHEKSREEMQREFDRRSREHHRNFLRLCGRLTKKKSNTNTENGFNNTFNGTLTTTGVNSFNNTMASRGQGAGDGGAAEPNAEFNQTFNQTFNGTIPLAAALKDLPISEDTITNTNRDDELNYATHVLPLVEQAAKDEDGDPMVFGLGTIGLAAREREREKQRYQQIQENGGVVPPDSARRGRPTPSHLSALPNNTVENEHVKAASPKAMSVFERLRQRQAPTSKSCSVARREQQLRTGGGGSHTKSRFDDENQRAFTMTEFLSLQRLIKFGLPLNAAVEALRRVTEQSDRAREREAAEAAAAAAAVNGSGGRSPTKDAAVAAASPGSRHLPPVDSAPPSASGTAQGPESRGTSRAGRRLPGLPSLAAPLPSEAAGKDQAVVSSTPPPQQIQLLTPLNQPGSQPPLFHSSMTGDQPHHNAAGVIPPAPPAPPPPGGVMDTFGYFATHRVQPLYYHHLESSNGGGAGGVEKTPSCSSVSPSASSLNTSSGTLRRNKKKTKNGGQMSSRNTSMSSFNNSTNRRRKQRQGSPPPMSRDNSFVPGNDSFSHSQNNSHSARVHTQSSETQTTVNHHRKHVEEDVLGGSSTTSPVKNGSTTRRRGVPKPVKQ